MQIEYPKDAACRLPLCNAILARCTRSAFGPKRTRGPWTAAAAFGGKADIPSAQRRRKLMTHSGHRVVSAYLRHGIEKRAVDQLNWQCENIDRLQRRCQKSILNNVRQWFPSRHVANCQGYPSEIGGRRRVVVNLAPCLRV